MKKRLLTALLSSFALAVLLPATAMAATPRTEVSGVVSSNGHPVTGAQVIVICDGHATKTHTDSTGTYLVQYKPSSLCPNGATAHVTATAGGQGGNNNGNVQGLTERLNVAIVNVSVVPEFGIITGVSASILGGGAFLAIRRRETSGYKV